jgi:DNA invertase Pin-like site-specific DNA recombinase
MKIGYARVSTVDQNLNGQLDALKAAGCNPKYIFKDKASGAKDSRPGLDAALAMVREGDVLVVWKLDRLARSIKHLIELSSELEARGAGLSSLSEAIDTSTPGGKMLFHVMGALAEFERSLISERTKTGLNAARARGRNGGAKESLSEQEQKRLVSMYQAGDTVLDVSKRFGITRGTVYRYLHKFEAVPSVTDEKNGRAKNDAAEISFSGAEN